MVIVREDAKLTIILQLVVKPPWRHHAPRIVVHSPHMVYVIIMALVFVTLTPLMVCGPLWALLSVCRANLCILAQTVVSF